MFLSMPMWRVIPLEGQPTQAPCSLICAMPSGVTPTSSTSPPSSCTAGRILATTPWTLSKSGLLSSGVFWWGWVIGKIYRLWFGWRPGCFVGACVSY